MVEHRDLESDVRAGVDEGTRQERRDKVSEEVSGQQRQDAGKSEEDVAGTNAEDKRPVPVQSAGTSSRRISNGDGTGRSTGTVHTTGDTRRGRAGISENVENAPVEFSGHNFHISEDDGIGSGGEKTKFKQNVDAIKLLKQIEREGRMATPSEQKILAKFNGWGTLASAFTNKEDWQKQAEQLKEILTPEEYDVARQVTPNAFYTPPKVAQAIWRGLERLGFKGGRILDPATGSGVFFGTMPSEIGAHSEINGVEYDSLTGRIARQLYQQANIDITQFQKRLMPNDYFDLIITNVPFGTTRIYSDKAYSKQGYMLHNYYFAKAIDKVRPGGLVAFITGTGTMQAQDAQATELREELSKKADLIAAFKLPDTTFKENAGTQVTSDILILQKRLDPAKPSEHAQDWSDVGLTFTSHSTNSTHINEYFEKHPENMIGEPTIDWRGSLALDGSGLDVAAELSKLIETLPENIFTPIQHNTQDSLKNTYAAMADATLRDGSFSVEGGKAIQLVEGDVVEVPKANQELVKDFVTLEKSLDNILKAQLSPKTTDAELAKLRETLNQNYDNFVQRHGNINSNPVLKILETDPNFGKVASIEKYTEKTETVPDTKGKGKPKTKKITSASKADIFVKRTASPFPVVNSTDL